MFHMDHLVFYLRVFLLPRDCRISYCSLYHVIFPLFRLGTLWYLYRLPLYYLNARGTTQVR
jgi:hypothetical protein